MKKLVVQSGYCPAVSRQRSQRDFCFRSQSGHLHEHCVQSQDSEITFASRSKICRTRAKIFQWSETADGLNFLLVFVQVHLTCSPAPASVIAQSSELGQEKLLKSHHSHHSGPRTGSASLPGAPSQLNPCSNATLQLKPSHIALNIFSTFILQYKFMVLTLREVFRMYKYT